MRALPSRSGSVRANEVRAEPGEQGRGTLSLVEGRKQGVSSALPASSSPQPGLLAGSREGPESLRGALCELHPLLQF